MKIFILSAEHFSVPGLILQAHATRESAVAEAIELTETMVGDSPYVEWEAVTDASWETIVGKLQDAHGAAHCYVEIAETELRGAVEWSGSPCPVDPDNFWIDDATGERVNAHTGERAAPQSAEGAA